MVPVVCFRAGIVDVLKLEGLDRALATLVPAHHFWPSGIG